MDPLIPQVRCVVVTLGPDPRVVSAIDALRTQVGVRLEVVWIENGASGASPDVAPPSGAVEALRVVRHAENLGLAGALESEMRGMKGGWFLTLNPDCRLDPDAVSAAVRTLDARRDAGAVAFHLRRPDGTVDSRGVVVHPLWLRARDRDVGADVLSPCVVDTVDAPCFAAALLRVEDAKGAADGAGEVFDTRFMAYYEDVDFGLRLRRSGRRVLFVPEASGVHDRGFRPGGRAAMPARVRRWSLRNRWWTMLKNVGVFGLLMRLPFLVLQETAVFGYLLVKEKGTIPAYLDVVAGLGATLARRRHRPQA